jgi:hypothetical protein
MNTSFFNVWQRPIWPECLPRNLSKKYSLIFWSPITNIFYLLVLQLSKTFWCIITLGTHVPFSTTKIALPLTFIFHFFLIICDATRHQKSFWSVGVLSAVCTKLLPSLSILQQQTPFNRLTETVGFCGFCFVCAGASAEAHQISN